MATPLKGQFHLINDPKTIIPRDPDSKSVDTTGFMFNVKSDGYTSEKCSRLTAADVREALSCFPDRCTEDQQKEINKVIECTGRRLNAIPKEMKIKPLSSTIVGGMMTVELSFPFENMQSPFFFPGGAGFEAFLDASAYTVAPMPSATVVLNPSFKSADIAPTISSTAVVVPTKDATPASYETSIEITMNDLKSLASALRVPISDSVSDLVSSIRLGILNRNDVLRKRNFVYAPKTTSSLTSHDLRAIGVILGAFSDPGALSTTQVWDALRVSLPTYQETTVHKPKVRVAKTHKVSKTKKKPRGRPRKNK